MLKVLIYYYCFDFLLFFVLWCMSYLFVIIYICEFEICKSCFIVYVVFVEDCDVVM